MTNEAFVIRTGPSGPSMPQSTPGYVIKIQADGTSVKAEPETAGGSVTPLTAALVGDSNGTATTPTGAYSGDKAYKGVGALPALIAALAPTGGGGIELAPGSYSGVDAPLAIQEQVLTIRGLGAPGQPPTGVRIFGNITLNASDAQCSLTVQDLACGADVDDGGTGADFHVVRGSASGAVTITGSYSADSAPCGAVTASAATCTGASFDGANHYLGASLINACTYTAGLHLEGGGRLLNTNIDAGQLQINAPFVMMTCEVNSASDTCLLLATGASRVNNSAFLGVVQFGDGTYDVRGSIFAKTIATTANGVLKMYDCVYDTGGGAFTVASAHLFLDSESELNMLLAGVDVEVTIHALDLGQGGDAVFVSDNNATVDYAAETRGYLGQNVLTAGRTFKINGAGAADDNKEWWIDNYNRTGNDLTVTDEADATIATLSQVAVGTGERWVFGVDPTTHKTVLQGIKKLTH